MAFEVATYTDVVASEAVDGVDGFNFQSLSAGVTGSDQQTIRASLLHRVVPSWAREHDPLSHPATCAYLVRGGRFYLSRGKSTGDTNSGRAGNQITQAIITEDPNDFIPYRPAQLYGAAEWRLEKAPGLVSDRWNTPLDIRPEFEIAALEDLVTDDDWARSTLPHFLTMIDAAAASEPKTLIIVHDDLDLVMRWIALGTLFVDVDVASRLQFRALVDDPWSVEATIVGLSPGFGGADLAAANVLDLSNRSMPSIEPSDSARVHAAWFLEHGGDDSLYAIDIARRWEPVLGAGLATDAARIVGLPQAVTPGQSAWQASTQAAELLACEGLRDDLELYADELCDAIVGYLPISAEEFGLVGRAIRAAHDLEVDDLASEMLVPTLEALVASPANIEVFAREVSGSSVPVRWDNSESREAASAFVAELMGAAAADVLPGLFAAARVIAAPIAEPALSEAIGRLAAAWVEKPSLGRTSWRDWLAGEAVLAATARNLVGSLERGDEVTLASLLEGDWDMIATSAECLSLQGWLDAAQLARVSPDDRDKTVASATSLPDGVWRAALAGSSLPRHARLWGTWITHHGLSEGMAASLKARFREICGLDSADATAAEGGDWQPLMDPLSQSTDAELASFAQQYFRARAGFKRSRDEVSVHPEARLDSCLPYPGRLTPLLLLDVGWLLLNSTNPQEVGRLMQAASPWGSAAIRQTMLALVDNKQALQAIGYGLSLRTDPDPVVASSADKALSEIFAGDPGLLKLAKRQTSLKDALGQYLQERPGAGGRKSRLGGTFGRSKGGQGGGSGR